MNELPGNPTVRPLPPLRRVVSRRPDREVLECGHEHENTYRKAKRRRCKLCVVWTENCQQQHPLDTYEPIREVREPGAESATATVTDSTAPVIVSIPPPATDAPRCAYCHDDLDQKVTACPKCRTVVHRDCAKELGGMCPTLGCRTRMNQGATEEALAPKVIRVSLAPRPVRQRFWAAVLAFILVTIPLSLKRAFNFLLLRGQ